ncbi:hypothetical protein A3K89_03500 [Rhodococcoides kyotonense]|uniref:Uncharacterized protein n=1 Tax=Rhodococcoides kyotonense TaxID=398843 RepID=A0A177YG72_9NOCA|nr:hypothetical protein A3K89_03500 [Rhodococcus kyotonensis]
MVQDLGQKVDQRLLIDRPNPAIDGDSADVGAESAQSLAEVDRRLPLGDGAVQLDSDVHARNAFRCEMIGDFLGCLGRRRPDLAETGAANGAACLGASRDDARGPEGRQKFLTVVPALGRVEPAAETDTGTDDRQFGRAFDEVGGLLTEIRVVEKRENVNRGDVHGPRAAAFEQRGELVRPPFGGQCDRLPRQWSHAGKDRRSTPVRA